MQALESRRNGDPQAALNTIRAAMERLAALGSELDPNEGAMMRLIAERFTAALVGGDKGAAKEIVNVMRHKAGDPKDDENPDW